jgi:transposase
LTQLRGAGFIVAAKILGEVGDLSRLRSKGSFAMLTGTAPLEASSGKTKRHRLNRGGNRQLNYALHMWPWPVVVETPTRRPTWRG